MIPVEYGTSVDLCVFVCVWFSLNFVSGLWIRIRIQFTLLDSDPGG